MEPTVPPRESLQAIVDKACAAWPPAGGITNAPFHTHPDGEARHRKKILQHLDTYPPVGGPDSLHIGVAGYYNLELICKARPQHVLLMDANTNQQRYWSELFAMLAKNSTVEGFREELSQRMVRGSFQCADGTVLKDRFAHEEPLKGLDYLSDNGNYAYLHRLAGDGCAAFATANLITENEKCAAIGRALRNAGFDAQTAYWSNIGSFFHASRGGVIVTRDDDVFGQEKEMFADKGLTYKNSGFYKSDESATQRWQGYESQEQRNAMPYEEVPAYEKFLENTSVLGGLHTMHMYSHASDKIRNIHRYPLILTEGPLRRLPEQIEQRQQRRTEGEPALWQDHVEAATRHVPAKSR